MGRAHGRRRTWHECEGYSPGPHCRTISRSNCTSPEEVLLPTPDARRPTPDARRPQRYYGVSRLAPLRPPVVGPGKLDAGQGASLRGVRQQVLPMSLGSLIAPLLKWLYSRRPTPDALIFRLWGPVGAFASHTGQLCAKYLSHPVPAIPPVARRYRTSTY